MSKSLKQSPPLKLDLGRVGVVAKVFINGQSAGIAWKAIYQIDIGPFVHKRRNEIEIRVANLWVNR